MPRPKALTPSQAKRTLANRLGPRVDSLRQFTTKFGLRSQRCFLVHTRWTGEERGDGQEAEVSRVELLPTPKVESLDSVALNPFSAGLLPVGSIRLSRVSIKFTFDQLKGRFSGKDSIPAKESFFYELVEDGRGDNPPHRAKYRLAATPARREGGVHWVLVLERMSEDEHRDGTSAMDDVLHEPAHTEDS